jgi:hypothetical protein
MCEAGPELTEPLGEDTHKSTVKLGLANQARSKRLPEVPRVGGAGIDVDTSVKSGGSRDNGGSVAAAVPLLPTRAVVVEAQRVSVGADVPRKVQPLPQLAAK